MGAQAVTLGNVMWSAWSAPEGAGCTCECSRLDCPCARQACISPRRSSAATWRGNTRAPGDSSSTEVLSRMHQPKNSPKTLWAFGHSKQCISPKNAPRFEPTLRAYAYARLRISSLSPTWCFVSVLPRLGGRQACAARLLSPARPSLPAHRCVAPAAARLHLTDAAHAAHAGVAPNQ